MAETPETTLEITSTDPAQHEAEAPAPTPPQEVEQPGARLPEDAQTEVFQDNAADLKAIDQEVEDGETQEEALLQHYKELGKGLMEEGETHLFAAAAIDRMKAFNEEDEKRNPPLADRIAEIARPDQTVATAAEKASAFDWMDQELDAMVEKIVAGGFTEADLISQYGYNQEDLDGYKRDAGIQGPVQGEQLASFVKQAIPFDEFAKELVQQKLQEVSPDILLPGLDAMLGDESIEQSASQDAGGLEGSASTEEVGDLEKEKSRREKILESLKQEAVYQFFDNKQNNLETFLQAFFGVSWQDRGSYGRYDRMSPESEAQGKQLGMKTMKESLGGGSEPTLNASIFRSVIRECIDAAPGLSIGGKSAKELVTMQDSDLLGALKSSESQQDLLKIFSGGETQSKALYRMSEWVKGSSGDDEARKSKTQLQPEMRQKLQTNLPKDGNYGVSQEALAYLLSRIS